MIRIYLDWNVISSLKKPEFREIKEFIDKHKRYLQLPYSPAHFTDLMKSYRPDNEYFNIDLETLDYISGKHHIRWEKDRIEPLFGTPKDFFEGVKDNDDFSIFMDIEKTFQNLDNSIDDLGIGKIGNMMKSLFQTLPSNIEITEENKEILKKMFPNLKVDSSMWDLMKDIGPFSQKLLQDGKYYKGFRNSMAEQGFKLEANSGNWEYDKVIKNIDDFLLSSGLEMTYLKYVETTLELKKKPINQYEYYTTAYLMLDLIGYKTDRLPKPTDNMQNIQADGEHSFYGGYCDYFVAMDKKLRIKSKVLYNEFNISTKIIEPKDFISEIGKVIDPMNNQVDFIEEVTSSFTIENLVESNSNEDNNEIKTYAFKLPKFYFNYFNYVICTNYPEHDLLVLTFRKVFKNFARFIYYTESEALIDSLTDYFGYKNKEELRVKKKDFIYEDTGTTLEWNIDGRLIILENEEETKRPILKYLLSTKKSD